MTGELKHPTAGDTTVARFSVCFMCSFMSQNGVTIATPKYCAITHGLWLWNMRSTTEKGEGKFPNSK